MTSQTIWVNGQFQDDQVPVFHIHDRVRYGDGVFDTILAMNGVLIHADLHFKRLHHHAKLVGIDIPNHGELLEAAQELLRQNNTVQGKMAVNTIITRGHSTRGLHIPENTEPTITIRISAVPGEYPPVHAIIAQSVRRNEGSPLSRIKSLNYGDNILALKEALAQNANESFLFNNAGYLTCATAGNVFALRQNQLITPPLSDGVLDGITRRLIIEQYGAQESSLNPEDLRRADGLYITNSIRGAIPVHSLDGTPLPQPSIIHSDIHLA